VPGASIGAVHNCQPCLPENDAPENVVAAKFFDECWNCAFPDPVYLGRYSPELARLVEPFQQAGDMARISRPVDWFGLNHYSPNYVRADAGNQLGFCFGAAPADTPRSGIGWPINPDAFRTTLLDLTRKFRLPIYVLENGTGSDDKPDERGRVVDQTRIDFLKAYTEKMFAAIREGADVRGYFVWSLLDNFEWGSGYGQRFGMVYVDYKTQQRTPKASAQWFADLIAATPKK
jgi:beta-glucosidase